MVAMAVGCVTRLQAVDEPAIRLFLFHCAGGSHLLFRGWERAFPADWDLCAIEAPGRGRLADYPLATDANALANFILPSMVPLMRRPFALFGHSMGALVAYDLTRRFASAGLPQPVWVGISSRRAPHRSPATGANHSYMLPDPDLKQVVLDMGGTPHSVVSDPRMWAIMAPILRTDLKIGETWSAPAAPDFEPPPFSLFGGTEDPFAPVEYVDEWSRYTRRVIGRHYFPGGHFFLQHSLQALAGGIVRDVAEACTAPLPA